jgi:hypothetical protein
MTSIASGSRSLALVVGAALGAIVEAGSAEAAPCGPEARARVLEPARPAQRAVRLTCELTLAQGDVVTKQIVFSGRGASGASLDCGGATIDGGPTSVNRGRDMIVVRSQGETAAAMAADRPDSITVKNCRIFGSVRVIGLGNNGENERVRASSFLAGHTERLQAAAPTGITFAGLTITASGRTPFYLAPGVTGVTLQNSSLSGRSDGPGIYLDAESGHNRILGNRIAVETTRREQIAVDGSADNLIRDNRFSALSNGGIHLYRNCGEGGTVRHQAPRRNVIADNEFYYARYIGPSPAIWLGSRNGWRWYCILDRGHPFGSSIDDRDHAEDNTVTGNRFVDRPPEAMIRDSGTGNRVVDNHMISRPTR